MTAGHGRAAGRRLIKGARPLGGPPADILIDGQVIADVRASGSGGRGSEPDSDVLVIDADGLIALPGLVDLHTHLREPGREDAETVESGTAAAALGGFTAIHAMANTEPVADTAGVVEQVANGVSVRMAVLYLLLGGSAGPAEPSVDAARELTGAGTGVRR